MSIACAALMCHAPIVIPAIAGERAVDCAETTRAMREAARALVAHDPEVLVLISPHSPRHRTRFGLLEADALQGTFARFGHGSVRVHVNGARAAARTLAATARTCGVDTQPLELATLDHGALVPLYFLQEAGFRGGVLLVALPYPGADSEVAFGRAIRAAAQTRNERWAVLASGDMSHRLTPDAPAGYDPEARAFDEAFVTELRRGELRRALELPPALIALAAEDVVQSTAVAAGSIDFEMRGARVLSYEGPFGVGYCEALLFEERARPPQAIVDIAVEAIRAELTGARYEPPSLPEPWTVARAVFVTLRAPDGELRGCIGRTAPLTSTLAAEVAECAVSAARRDPRVPPIEARELATLRVEVSVLGVSEPVDDPTQLDPKRYGVIVSHGARRGVLLPDIEGVDSVADQLAIVLRKAAIPRDAPYRLERFAVDKVSRVGSKSAAS
jgi:MEMO1 family protein